MKKIYCLIFLTLLAACSSQKEQMQSLNAPRELDVRIADISGLSSPSTKVAYSGPYGEHTEFETGDFFGLFVLDDSDNIKACNYRVYCSGLDNDGKTVWSIFKPGSSDDNTSNHPISDVLALGSEYFAYYPYNEAYSSITSCTEIRSIVSDFLNALPADQSAAYTDYDLIVASNIPGCEYGEVLVSGKSVSLTLAHTAAMLRYCIPTGSVKYEYRFDGVDFTPCLLKTIDGIDEFRYIFKPGCTFDLSVKYVLDEKLFKIETGNMKNLWPVITAAGHCYALDQNAPKVPTDIAVDMGTSVKWAPFNLGTENDRSATAENISKLKGTCVMWGVNVSTSGFGASAYNSYNNTFTAGTKPSELPLGYSFSGDPVYDAARNLWGGEWRIPTADEWKELFSACTFTVQSGAVIFTSKTTGNKLTLALVGYYDSSTVSGTNTAYYWSSESNPTTAGRALSTRIYSGATPAIHSTASRYTGLPVRPVVSK